MDYNSVHLMSNNLVLVSPQDVAQLESQLGTRMPTGYREYVTTLGLGILNDTVRVYTPRRISRELNDVRARWNEYWFWDAGRDVLSKDKALECIIVADTSNGDELIFHPSQPDTLYALPHSSGQIYGAGRGLDEAIEWTLHSGVLFPSVEADESERLERPAGLYFEPFPSEADPS